MPSKHNRVTEAEVGLAVLQVLYYEPDGTADVPTIKHKITERLNLSDDDLAQSLTRTNEELWEQQVRNQVSHKDTPGNIFCEGLAEILAKGTWRITDRGRLHLENKRFV